MLFRFRNFPVYKLTKDFRKELREFIKEKFPKDERFGLTDQALRALDSICLHIAEGSNRTTDKDFARFLNGALTSLEEVICCLDLAVDDGYITEDEFLQKQKKAEEIGKQLVGFQRKLRGENRELRTKNRELKTEM